MAISINRATKKITVPKADLTLISGTLYEYDTNAFRLEIKALDASESGITYLRATKHNTTVTVVGETYARTIQIINGYSVEFEDGAYSVILRGSNNDIWDIQSGILVQNQVQVIPTNSGGLISGVELLKFLRNELYLNPTAGKMQLFDDAGVAVEYEGEIFSGDAGTTPYDGTAGVTRRNRLERT